MQYNYCFQLTKPLSDKQEWYQFIYKIASCYVYLNGLQQLIALMDFYRNYQQEFYSIIMARLTQLFDRKSDAYFEIENNLRVS